MVTVRNPFSGKEAIVAEKRFRLDECQALACSKAQDVWLLRSPKLGWYFLAIFKAPPGWVKLLTTLEALETYNRMTVRLVPRGEAFPPARELPEAPPPREGAIVHLDPQPRAGTRWPQPSTNVRVKAAIEPEEAARVFELKDCQLLAHDHDHPRTPGTARFLYRAPTGEYFALRLAGSQINTMKLDRSAAQIWWETMPTKAADYQTSFDQEPEEA